MFDCDRLLVWTVRSRIMDDRLGKTATSPSVLGYRNTKNRFDEKKKILNIKESNSLGFWRPLCFYTLRFRSFWSSDFATLLSLLAEENIITGQGSIIVILFSFRVIVYQTEIIWICDLNSNTLLLWSINFCQGCVAKKMMASSDFHGVRTCNFMVCGTSR